MRRIRITENAYQAAKRIGKGMRVKGYRLEVSLVASALIVYGSRDNDKEAVTEFVCELFSVERQGMGKQD
ncbi:MAG: hypothetical protein ACRED0_00390 [Gammaproteobacteria bacterium]